MTENKRNSDEEQALVLAFKALVGLIVIPLEPERCSRSVRHSSAQFVDALTRLRHVPCGDFTVLQ
jgi:hypothetical protein